MEDTWRGSLLVAGLRGLGGAGGTCLVEVAWGGPSDRIELHYLPTSSEMLDILICQPAAVNNACMPICRVLRSELIA
jgi:hypothetical protein